MQLGYYGCFDSYKVYGSAFVIVKLRLEEITLITLSLSLFFLTVKVFTKVLRLCFTPYGYERDYEVGMCS